jgi:hypothetical protein
MHPPIPPPIPWTNQDIALYHGTLDTHVPSIRAGVLVHLGRLHTDFGQGFYTTTEENQARSWAWQLEQRNRVAHPGCRAAVVQFDAPRDDLAALEAVWFVRGVFDAEDFWSLIFYSRSGMAAHGRATPPGWYDVAIGPVAASWRRRIAFRDMDQISFHTPKAAGVLNVSPKRATVLGAGGIWSVLP